MRTQTNPVRTSFGRRGIEANGFDFAKPDLRPVLHGAVAAPQTTATESHHGVAHHTDRLMNMSQPSAWEARATKLAVAGPLAVSKPALKFIEFAVLGVSTLITAYLAMM